MSSSTSKPEQKKPDAATQKAADEKLKPKPHLGVLEEDDEFEEFPVADWDDSETDLAQLGAAAPGAAKSGGDKLWEDNWDDDDVEEEFSAQLRGELLKTKGGAGPMEH